MSEDVRTCVSCMHFGGESAEVYNPHPNAHGLMREVKKGPECRHPKAKTRDLVFGKAFCIDERNFNKGCGKQGKLWEPQKKET